MITMDHLIKRRATTIALIYKNLKSFSNITIACASSWMRWCSDAVGNRHETVICIRFAVISLLRYLFMYNRWRFATQSNTQRTKEMSQSNNERFHFIFELNFIIQRNLFSLHAFEYKVQFIVSLNIYMLLNCNVYYL